MEHLTNEQFRELPFYHRCCESRRRYLEKKKKAYFEATGFHYIKVGLPPLPVDYTVKIRHGQTPVIPTWYTVQRKCLDYLAALPAGERVVLNMAQATLTPALMKAFLTALEQRNLLPTIAVLRLSSLTFWEPHFNPQPLQPFHLTPVISSYDDEDSLDDNPYYEFYMKRWPKDLSMFYPLLKQETFLYFAYVDGGTIPRFPTVDKSLMKKFIHQTRNDDDLIQLVKVLWEEHGFPISLEAGRDYEKTFRKAFREHWLDGDQSYPIVL